MKAAIFFAAWIGIPSFWTPSTILGSRPTAIVRDFSGALRYEACQGIGSAAVIIHGGGPGCCEPCNLSGPISLTEWCAALRALPVPAKFKPSDPTDLYSAFQGRGVCP